MNVPAEHLQTSAGVPRIAALDSLRGLASLAVLLGHTLAVCKWDSDFSCYFLINNAFDGRSAVTMFFVLSGFVLTFGHLSAPSRPFTLLPFFARRVTRIWLPWFAFFVLSLIAQNFLYFPPPPLIPPITEHHASFWSESAAYGDLFKQLFFLLHNSKRMLLPQDWSLGIEMKASILIPLFLVIARKNWIFLIALAAVILIFKSEGGYYYSSFAIGVLTARLAAQPQPIKSGWHLALLGILFYQIRWLQTESRLLPQILGEREIWLIGSIGCSMIILATMRSPKFSQLLQHPCLTYLGRISYSLYLVQVIVLVCLAPWLVHALNLLKIYSHTPQQIIILSLVTASCLMIAHMGERWIEVPCIRLGRTLTNRMNRSKVNRRIAI